MTKNAQPLVAPLSAISPMTNVQLSFLSRSEIGPISVSRVPAIDHWLLEQPPARRRIANGPSQAEIARAIRAVKQAGGGFDVEVMPDRSRLAASQGGGPGTAPKSKKSRDFVL
jgi:hypothetical protein